MTKSIPFKLPPYEEDASHVMWTRYLLQGTSGSFLSRLTIWNADRGKGEAVLKGDVEALSTPGADVEIISPMIDHIMTLGFAIQRCRNCVQILVCERFSGLKLQQSSAKAAMRSSSRTDRIFSTSRCTQQLKNRRSRVCVSLSATLQLRRTEHQRSGTKP